MLGVGIPLEKKQLATVDIQPGRHSGCLSVYTSRFRENYGLISSTYQVCTRTRWAIRVTHCLRSPAIAAINRERYNIITHWNSPVIFLMRHIGALQKGTGMLAEIHRKGSQTPSLYPLICSQETGHTLQ